MNPFVGPSMFNSMGNNGGPVLATPFVQPGGMLPQIAPSAFTPAIPMGVFTPAISMGAFTPAPRGFITPAAPMRVLTPATPRGFITPVIPQRPLAGSWVPHPLPDPVVPASAFWTPQWFSAPRVVHDTPIDVATALRLTGGVPLPGAAPVGWAPVWPPPQNALPDTVSIPIHLNPYLAPNPCGQIPFVAWDISQPPVTAKRVTGRNCVVDLTPQFGGTATWPAVKHLQIASDSCMEGQFWGPIIVQSKEEITVWDVMNAIYEHFQQQLTQSEVDYISDLHPVNYRMMKDAWDQRCRKSNSLRDWERRQGLRRIDVLGDEKCWYGAFPAVIFLLELDIANIRH